MEQGDAQEFTFSVEPAMLRCPVCKETPMLEPVCGSCSHSVCYTCSSGLSRCPVCNNKTKKFTSNWNMRQLLEKLPAYTARLRANSIDALKEELHCLYPIQTFKSTYSDMVTRSILRRVIRSCTRGIKATGEPSHNDNDDGVNWLQVDQDPPAGESSGSNEDDYDGEQIMMYHLDDPWREFRKFERDIHCTRFFVFATGAESACISFCLDFDFLLKTESFLFYLCTDNADPFA